MSTHTCMPSQSVSLPRHLSWQQAITCLSLTPERIIPEMKVIILPQLGIQPTQLQQTRSQSKALTHKHHTAPINQHLNESHYQTPNASISQAQCNICAVILEVALGSEWPERFRPLSCFKNKTMLQSPEVLAVFALLIGHSIPAVLKYIIQ